MIRRSCGPSAGMTHASRAGLSDLLCRVAENGGDPSGAAIGVDKGDSFEDLGRLGKALCWYDRRSRMEGSDEET
jgi:hypothetical protein